MDASSNAANSQISESDLKKFMLQVKSEMQQVCSGADIKKNTEKVVEWYNSAPHRIVKLLCYPLLKNCQDGDLSDISSTLVQDLSSKDDEIQLNAMKLLYLLKQEQAGEIIRSNIQLLTDIIKNGELNFERLLLLHDFFLKAFLKSQREEECKEQITQFYLLIGEQIFGTNRDITRNAIEVFIGLYEAYQQNCSFVQTQDYYFDGKGTVKSQLQPLIIKITNLLTGRLESVLAKIGSYEIRLRSHLMKLVVSLLKVIVELSDQLYGYTKDSIGSSFIVEQYELGTKYEQSLNLSEFTQRFLFTNIFKDILQATYELDVLANSYMSVFALLFLSEQRNSLIPFHLRCKALWELFLHFSVLLAKHTYRKEYNLFLLNFMSLASRSSLAIKITISMRILEITVSSVSSQFNRFYIMISAFFNMISASQELLSLNRPSCIFSLFSQQWFLSKINAGDPEEIKDKENSSVQSIKEELLIGLTIAAILAKRMVRESHDTPESQKMNSYLDSIVLEVMDVCSRIINWKSQSSRDGAGKTISLAIDTYLFLLEESMNFLEGNELAMRVGEVIKRINLGEMSFLPRLKCMYLILKNSQKEWCNGVQEQMELNSALPDLRGFLIPPQLPSFFSDKYFEKVVNLSPLNRYFTHLEYALSCLASFPSYKKGINTDNQSVIQLLEDFKKSLSSNQNQKGYFPGIFEVIQTPLDSLLLKLKENKSQELDEGEEVMANDQESTELQSSEQTFLKKSQPSSISKFQFISTNDIRISRKFLEELEIEPSDKSKLQDSEPEDILFLAINQFYRDINLPQIFYSDFLETDSPLKIISSLSLRSQNESLQNTNVLMETSPKLISGLSDCLQIYASHATYNFKQLLSLQLKLFNQTQFRITNVKIRVLNSNGVGIFPQESTPKFFLFDEINPMSMRDVCFCLNIKVVESEDISLEVTVGDVRFKTKAYKVGLWNLIVPNHVIQLCSYAFNNLWIDFGHQFIIHTNLTSSLRELINAILKSNFSCAILEEEYTYLSQKIFSFKNNCNQKDDQHLLEEENSMLEHINEIKVGDTITLGMLGWTWDGVSIAIKISNIKKQDIQNEGEQVVLEFKSSKLNVLEIVKENSREFIQNIFKETLEI